MAVKTADRAGVFVMLRATPMPVRYLLTGVVINQMGAFVQTFIVLYLVSKGFSAGQAGIVLSAYSVGAVLGSLFGAEVTGRLGSRVTIAGAMATSAAVLAFVPALSKPGLLGFLIVVIALAGVATQSYRPAAAVLLSELMPEPLRVSGFSMMRIALNIGAAVSPLIAAALITVSWNLLLWLDAATALVYATLALALLPDIRTPHAEKQRSADGMWSVYGELLRDRKYLYFLMSVLIGSIIYVQYTVALPLKITADHHPVALYSAVLVTASVVLVVCELKITSYVTRWPGYVAASAGTAVMAIGLVGYGLGTNVTLLVLSTVVFVFGIMINGPTMFAYPATFPAAVKARYIGAQQAMFGLGVALGPAFGVLAWESLHNSVWWLCGALGMIAALCALLGMKAPTTESYQPRKINERLSRMLRAISDRALTLSDSWVIFALTACFAWTVLGLAIWASTGLHPDHYIHTTALFVHLAALVLGFGSVLVADYFGLRWLARRCPLSETIHVTGRLHLPIWLGVIGLILSGMFLEPNLGHTLTQVKLVLVGVLTLNGLQTFVLSKRLEATTGAVSTRLLAWGAASTTVSQVCWWGSMWIGFWNTTH
jgi:MFS family permease